MEVSLILVYVYIYICMCIVRGTKCNLRSWIRPCYQLTSKVEAQLGNSTVSAH